MPDRTASYTRSGSAGAARGVRRPPAGESGRCNRLSPSSPLAVTGRCRPAARPTGWPPVGTAPQRGFCGMPSPDDRGQRRPTHPDPRQTRGRERQPPEIASSSRRTTWAPRRSPRPESRAEASPDTSSDASAPSPTYSTALDPDSREPVADAVGGGRRSMPRGRIVRPYFGAVTGPFVPSRARLRDDLVRKSLPQRGVCVSLAAA